MRKQEFITLVLILMLLCIHVHTQTHSKTAEEHMPLYVCVGGGLGDQRETY